MTASSEEGRSISFRGRNPNRLAFGTSGLRGLVEDLSDLEVYINVRGFLKYLQVTDDLRPGDSVAIGGDLRPSTDGPQRSIVRAVDRAIRDSGFVSVNCGKVPTPALTLFGVARGIPSVMVTGSHIPFDRNGIKFNKRGGEVLKEDEKGIGEAVDEVRKAEYGKPPDASIFDDGGWFRPGVNERGGEVSGEAGTLYLERYLGFFPGDSLRGLRLLVYQHSAVGRDLTVQLLEGLGATAIPVGRSERFVPIDTEAITQAHLSTLQLLADEARSSHGQIDAVVSTDGDGDRPLLLGVASDGELTFFPGDLVGLITAEHLGADSVAVPVSSSDAIDIHLHKRGISPVRTRIGSPYVISAVQSSDGHRKVGWEANGGFLLGSDLHQDGRVLSALLTRDAMLPIVACLRASVWAQKPLIDLLKGLPQRFGRAGLLDEFPSETSKLLLSALSPRGNIPNGEASFEGRGLPFPTGEVLPNGLDEEVAQRLVASRDILSRHFSPERGFDRIVRINFLDGIRVFFQNGEVAHIRPSGNAPQLRIYSVAANPDRAEEIVRLGVADPGGILRGLEAEVAAQHRSP